MTTDKYDELAPRAERGELTLQPGSIRRGAEVGADAQRALIESDIVRETFAAYVELRHVS
ncbi:hypothetical protein ACO2Q7_03715 [Rathayibacter sp. KR2-224]|uniref:hypothetical protein n=1 Tax=Rathayibacter sp. KR2-224 TaxID=3400913 RepID=UPI003C10B6E9